MLAYNQPFVSLGKVISTHGYKGEVKVELTGDFLPKSKKMELLFVDFPPAPVPFFISKIQQNSETLFTLHFKGLSNPEEAQKLVNRSVLLPKNLIKTVEQEVSLEDYLIGFSVEDKVIGKIGKIIAVEEGVQDLLVVETPEKGEVLIPAVEAFILKVDEKKKVLFCHLPPGLLDL
jgi:16S rRNA processing protein RimM